VPRRIFVSVTTPTSATHTQAAVIYNPLKVELRKLKEAVAVPADPAQWSPTFWLATTEKDAGQRVTASALRRGADLVLVAGGDGTVRAVAEGLRGSGVPLAVLPSGTGNLLARNLNLPLNNLADAVDIAFTGVDRPIDLGIAAITRADGNREEHVFAVMAGLGIDAKMIANTSTTLKKAVGWLAYVDGTVRSLPELEPVRLRYSRDGGTQKMIDVHSIMIGNCGSLPGGILLIPDAKPDDGLLDIVAFRPRGPFGWLRVWNKITWENGVLRKSAVGRKIIDLSRDVKDVTYWRGKDLSLWVESAQHFQLDGDEFGEATHVHTSIDPGALIARVPGP
jgi:diacylglycerol kinase (ATP)